MKETCKNDTKLKVKSMWPIHPSNLTEDALIINIKLAADRRRRRSNLTRESYRSIFRWKQVTGEKMGNGK